MRTQARSGRRRNRNAGFSLIESLIAAGILLGIVLGVLPMFTRAMLNNTAGGDSSSATNFSKSEVERLLQTDFNSPQTLVPGGANSLVRPAEAWIQGAADHMGDERWTTAPTAGDAELWVRTATVRQYSVRAFDDRLLADNEALSGDADPLLEIHIKELDAQMYRGVLASQLPATIISDPSRVQREMLKMRLRLLKAK